jgi:class 3 adenylate cyclase
MLPSGTVTFLFTDIEGSTGLWEQHPDSMRVALARHDEMLPSAVTGSGGTVVKTTGDGVHAVFAEAAAAVGAAIEAQRRLGAEDWGALGRLRVRMGLHTGSAELREGDYFGPTLNRAARLMSAAHGGQVAVSLVRCYLCWRWRSRSWCP